ncbi:MAG TPA: alpha/beta fold hydrolase [Actinomycetota bacterium]|nr:alpha/beta fold hydrolase [Actinomycetota bacterium]
MRGRTAALLQDLPARYLGEGSVGAPERVRITAGRVSRDIVLSSDDCSVEPLDGHRPDAEIITDPDTWCEIHEGRLSGIEAFAAKRLWARGSIDTLLRFETMFERPAAGGLSYEMAMVDVAGVRVSTLIVGPVDGRPLLLMHGLGATKASWLTVIPSLAGRYRVIVPDLPGFGASDKPSGRYDAPWFAIYGFSLLDVLGHRNAFVVGNSMGGRIAMEMAMLGPERIDALACLAPAAAFAKRPGLWLVKIARPELGYALSRVPRRSLKAGLRQLFANSNRLDESWYEAAVDDFLGAWNSPKARTAFFKSLRNIYLDEPFGETGFWTRLETMVVAPALFIYGANDPLITPRFGEKVQKALPEARVQTWPDCGHVPQLEHPERARDSLVTFLAGAERG